MRNANQIFAQVMSFVFMYFVPEYILRKNGVNEFMIIFKNDSYNTYINKEAKASLATISVLSHWNYTFECICMCVCTAVLALKPFILPYLSQYQRTDHPFVLEQIIPKLLCFAYFMAFYQYEYQVNVSIALIFCVCVCL